MRLLVVILFASTALPLLGCDFNKRDSQAPPPAQSAPESKAPAPGAKVAEGSTAANLKTAEVSLARVDAVQASTIAAERKIIRNANISIETDAPSEAMRKAAEIAEASGGFVVTSEFNANGGRAQGQKGETVTVVLRVPSSQFEQALERIRGIGSRVLQVKVSGQDVTEEFLDLEARIRTKKALEAQFLEIMKQAKTVPDALEVQRELADVRTEIERLEGRRRFLENQSALSTINVTLQMPISIVAANTTTFLGSIKQSLGEGVDMAASITLGLIRLLILLIPVGLLIILPLGLLARSLLRRITLPKKPAQAPINATGE